MKIERQLRGVVAIVLGVLLPPIGAGAANERKLTVDEAIALALEKSEGIIVERASLASAKEGVTGAKGAYDPFLEAEALWRHTQLPTNSAFSGAPPGEASPTIEGVDGRVSVRQLLPTGGEVSVRALNSRETTDGAFTLLSPAYGTQLGVELRQPLLRDRAVDAARIAMRVASSDRDRAQASFEREVADTVAAVERAYWTLVAARRDVDVRDEAVRLADEQLKETGTRIEKGAAPETEIAQPRSELERRRGEFLAAREAVYRSENALKLLILSDTDVALWSDRITPEDEPDVTIVPVDTAAAMDRALASRPELQDAAAFLERRRAETELAVDSVRPTLDALVSYDKYGLAGSRNPAGTSLTGLPLEIPSGMEGGWGRAFGQLGEDRFEDARAGLVFSFPIGNRSARAAAATARNVERQAEAELSRARKEVRVEVLDAIAALETAGQRIESAKAAREAAEVQLSSERERYVAGLSTNFLVLTRQNDLSRARLDEISAQTDYRRARIELSRVTGSLIEDHGIDLDVVAP